MLTTKSKLVKMVAKKSGFYQRDVHVVMDALEEVIVECFKDVELNDEVLIQLCEGIKIGCSIVPERCRRDPRTQKEIVVGETVKPFCKFSERFREITQEQYDDKK